MNDRPRFSTEIRETKQHVFILAPETSRFVAMLRRKLEQYDNDVTVASHLPHSLKPFFASVFFDIKEKVFKDIVARNAERLIFIFRDDRETAERCAQSIANDTRGLVKVIYLETSFDYYDHDIEKIFWFSFSRSSETFLPIRHPKPQHAPTTAEASPGSARTHIHNPRRAPARRPFLTWERVAAITRPRNTITFIILITALVHFLFVPALALASYYHYRSAVGLQNGDSEASKSYLAKGTRMLAVSRGLYSYVRPTLSVFSLAVVPDDMFQMNQALNDVIVNGANLRSQSREFMELAYTPDKSLAQVDYMHSLKDSMVEKVSELGQDIGVLAEKVPGWNKQMTELKDQVRRAERLVATGERFFPYIDSVMGRKSEKKYLLLFANNMELRPGGGFIGSFGTVTVKDYSIKELKIYDVYDADGQLTAHIRPPPAIRDHLDQPHWFLRDSAFSPDFYENYQQAQFFLEKTLDMKDFDGVVLVTTTAIQNLLAAMDELYVPDFRETVTDKNFYIKAQLYAEKGFFPGSRQKKTFLSSVMNQLLIELPDASPMDVAEAIKKSLDEKQIVVYFDDRELQKVLDTMYWSGRTIKPSCTTPNPNCVADFLFPFDANLGVNKANFFVSKTIGMDVKIEGDGLVKHRVKMNYRNESYEDIFPGGRYKNYLQILLPQGVRIKRLTENGRIIEDYDLQADEYTRIGFLSEIAPKTSAEIVVDYELTKKLEAGSGVYQLVVQKQIGSPNSDLNLSVELPKNVYVANKNFSPIVKDGRILYNTSLSADKIFFIEFFKE
jgi:hypothetical protein